MARSQRVREDDVRAMLRLMGEVGELPAGGPARTDHLVRGIARLTGASVGFTTRFRTRGRGKGIDPYAAMHAGWTDAEFAEALRVAASDPLHDHINDSRHDAIASGEIAPGGVFVHETSRMSAEARRRRAGAAELFAHGTGGDIDLVVLAPAAAPGHVATVGLSRRDRRRPGFAARERQIAQLLWEAGSELHRRPLSAFEPRLWGAQLTERAAQVLDGLRAGLSIKQVGRHMGLSAYTVNDHVKAIYKRFGVCSRGELMALLATHA